MSVTNLTLRKFLRLMLDSDVQGDLVVNFAMQAFGVSHKDVSRLWNNLLCKKHGI